MPFVLRLDHDARFLRVSTEGSVDFAESLRAVRAAATELAGLGWKAVVDVREMDYTPSVKELKVIALEFVRLKPAFGGGVVFVVASDAHYYLGKLLAALTEPRGLRMGVVRSPDDVAECFAQFPET